MNCRDSRRRLANIQQRLSVAGSIPYISSSANSEWPRHMIDIFTGVGHFDNNTRSSDVVTLARPSPASSLKVTDRSFQYVSPHLWNQLPFSLCEPVSPLYAYLNPSSSPLSPSITPSLFHCKLKTYLLVIFPPQISHHKHTKFDFVD